MTEPERPRLMPTTATATEEGTMSEQMQLGFVEDDPRLPRAGAVISPDGFYRYQLWRAWDRSKPMLGYVMLNPSTADAHKDDPTIRRCVKRAANEGYGGIVVHNLYAYRTPSPKLLWDAHDFGGVDVVGRANDAYLEGMYLESPTVVCAWGAKARPDRVAVVLNLLSACDLRCLGLTNDGHPKHPLYIPDAQPLEPFGTPRDEMLAAAQQGLTRPLFGEGG